MSTGGDNSSPQRYFLNLLHEMGHQLQFMLNSDSTRVYFDESGDSWTLVSSVNPPSSGPNPTNTPQGTCEQGFFTWSDNSSSTPVSPMNPPCSGPSPTNTPQGACEQGFVTWSVNYSSTPTPSVNPPSSGSSSINTPEAACEEQLRRLQLNDNTPGPM